jgi:hypothetical protein
MRQQHPEVPDAGPMARTGRNRMKHSITTAVILLATPLPGWAAIEAVPEPGILPLLGIGVAAAVAVKFFRKK